MKLPIKLVALLVFIAMCGLLAWKLHELVAGPVELGIATAVPEQTKKFVTELIDGQFEAPPPAAYSNTIDRPIFFKDRRFPEQTPEPPNPGVGDLPTPIPPPAKTVLGNFRLDGVHIDGSARKALIGSGDNLADWHAIGDDVGGWKLLEITPDYATLQADDVRVQLQLYEPSPNHELTPD